MKLIKAFYEIITPLDGEDILNQIELAARTCYKSEGKIDIKKGRYWVIGEGNKIVTLDKTIDAISAKVLISKLISRGHEAMLEFGGNITVKFVCDRGVSHELVRHRIASFAQESTRYCNYGKDEHIVFIIPSWLKLKEDIITFNNYSYTNTGHDGHNTWINAMMNCEMKYNSLIKKGWSPQQARSVLPNSLKTEINVSTNIREWRHIFKLRTAKAAHPQMRELMCPLLDEFKSKIPILFDDINY